MIFDILSQVKENETMLCMSLEQITEVLEKLRQRIANGVKLNGYDDTTMGNKNTECTWGLCHDDPTLWNKPEYHKWPDQFEEYNRVAPNSSLTGVGCPLDTREARSRWGCFHHCRFFQGGRDNNPSQSQALKLYDDRLTEIKSVQGIYYINTHDDLGHRCYIDDDGLVTTDERNAAYFTSYDDFKQALEIANQQINDDFGWVGHGHTAQISR